LFSRRVIRAIRVVGPLSFPDRRPPRLCGDLSCVDVLPARLDSLDWARFLFTVRAAISSARASRTSFVSAGVPVHDRS